MSRLTPSLPNKRQRATVVAYALGIGLFFVALLSVLPLPDFLAKLLLDKGEGSVFPYPLTIQNLMWCIFSAGLGELYYRRLQAQGYWQSLKSGYLPEQPDVVLTQHDMGAIYRVVSKQKDELAGLIGNLVLRFQAGRSVEQTHEMLNSQLELWQYRLDIDYNLIRYLTWLIPTLGFIGTVAGIAQTLAYAGSPGVDPTAEGFLSQITLRLGVAFDTTLLALVMSAVLVFLMHVIQGREEQAIAQSGRYCLDNLIARLYTQ